MKQIDWDPEINQQLIEERGIAFEEVIFNFQFDGLLDDLDAIQKRALIEGISYQTHVSSVLHKYVSGSWRGVTADKALQADAVKPRR